MLGYLSNHWQGRQSLTWSFWVNLVGLRAALFGLQHLLTPEKGGDYSDHAALVLTLSFLINDPLLVWQIVGVIRACDRFYRHTGSQALVWGAQLSMVLIFFLTATYALQSWQFTIEVPDEENFLTRMDREHAEQYSLVIEGNVLRLGRTGLDPAHRRVAAAEPNHHDSDSGKRWRQHLRGARPSPAVLRTANGNQG